MDVAQEAPLTVRALRRHQADDGTVTLFVDYATDLSSRDYVGLVGEAITLWSKHRTVPEAQGAAAIMVRAHPRGSTNGTVTFPFSRSAAGEWEQPEVRTLPSGKQVVLVASKEQGEELFVDYLTELPMNEYCSLATEVGALWSILRADVQKTRVKKVFILPTDAPVGGTVVSYSFKRTGDGQWVPRGVCVDDARK